MVPIEAPPFSELRVNYNICKGHDEDVTYGCQLALGSFRDEEQQAQQEDHLCSYHRSRPRAFSGSGWRCCTTSMNSSTWFLPFPHLK